MANAGVVGMAEVVVPSSAPAGGSGTFSGSPAMWSFVWVGFATLLLVTMHLAIVGRSSR